MSSHLYLHSNSLRIWRRSFSTANYEDHLYLNWAKPKKCFVKKCSLGNVNKWFPIKLSFFNKTRLTLNEHPTRFEWSPTLIFFGLEKKFDSHKFEQWFRTICHRPELCKFEFKCIRQHLGNIISRVSLGTSSFTAGLELLYNLPISFFVGNELVPRVTKNTSSGKNENLNSKCELNVSKF